MRLRYVDTKYCSTRLFIATINYKNPYDDIVIDVKYANTLLFTPRTCPHMHIHIHTYIYLCVCVRVYTSHYIGQQNVKNSSTQNTRSQKFYYLSLNLQIIPNVETIR